MVRSIRTSVSECGWKCVGVLLSCTNLRSGYNHDHLFFMCSQLWIVYSLRLCFCFVSVFYCFCFFRKIFNLTFTPSRKITRIMKEKKIHELFACASRVAVFFFLLFAFFLLFRQEWMDRFACKFRNYSLLLLSTTSSTSPQHDIYVWYLIIVINSY